MIRKKQPLQPDADAGYTEALRRIGKAEHTNAKYLNLSRLGLERLPPEVGRLTALVTLNLDGNRLTSLPPEVGRLTALVTLDLDGNQLASLPREVYQLTALTDLFLNNNQLTSLPPEIGQLTALTALHLRRNRLESLPPEVGRLTALTELGLGGNRLTALPPEVAGLTALMQLYLHENPALGLPPEVLGPTWDVVGRNQAPKPPADILAYYFARLSGPKRRLNEAKLLIVGEGEVGKSSLVERLIKGTFTAGMGKTEGIGREVWNVYRPPGGAPGRAGGDRADEKPIRVNVWDFGGQEVMHATHQFFLTRRSLYVVVLAGRGGENQGRLDYWLRAVQSYGGSSPIVIVANKCEEHKLEINVNGLKRDYGPNPIEFFRVSCKTNEGVPELKRRLEELIAGLENVNDEVPARFFPVKEELEEAATAKSYLERAEYDAICARHNLDNATEQDLLLRFLHELGTVLNFHDPESPYNLRDTHILNPEWVTEGVYDVLNNATLMRKGGTFKANDLGRLLKHPERYPEPKRPFIVDMMRKFEMAVDIPGQPGVLLVPELLTVNEPDLNWDEGAALNFEYGYTVLPSGLLPRFIVRMIGSATTTWRTGAVLRLDGCQALVRGDVAGNRVRVSVLGPVTRRRMALAAIRAQFREIHATVPGFKPEERVPLPDEPHLSVEYDHLLRLEDEGVTEFLPPKAGRKYTVEELLNGIETPATRAEYRLKLLTYQLRQDERTLERIKRKIGEHNDLAPAPPPPAPPGADWWKTWPVISLAAGLGAGALALVLMKWENTTARIILGIVAAVSGLTLMHDPKLRFRRWFQWALGSWLGANALGITLGATWKNASGEARLNWDGAVGWSFNAVFAVVVLVTGFLAYMEWKQDADGPR